MRDQLASRDGRQLTLAGVHGAPEGLSHAQVAQDGRSDLVAALVSAMAERQVRRKRVVTHVLEVVRAQLGREADAAALLAQVDDRAATGDGLRDTWSRRNSNRLSNLPHGFVELFAAIAAHAANGFASVAFRVNAHERGRCGGGGGDRPGDV